MHGAACCVSNVGSTIVAIMPATIGSHTTAINEGLVTSTLELVNWHLVYPVPENRGGVLSLVTSVWW